MWTLAVLLSYVLAVAAQGTYNPYPWSNSKQPFPWESSHSHTQHPSSSKSVSIRGSSLSTSHSGITTSLSGTRSGTISGTGSPTTSPSSTSTGSTGGGPSTSATQYSVKTPPLTTNWTYEVGTNPWPEYPRPQLRRTQWKSLNGIWTYQNASSLDAVNSPPVGRTLANEVLVPSCLESGLSGKLKFYNSDTTSANEIRRHSNDV